MDKHYNLTEQPNNGIKDKTPDWIQKFCEENKEGIKKDIRDVSCIKGKKSIFDL